MARYTVVEAARRLGVSKDTLLRWEKQKKIPAAPRLRRSGHRVYDDALIARVQKEYSDPVITPEEWQKSRRKKRA
jgi:excisionase family DNA binding protein